MAIVPLALALALTVATGVDAASDSCCAMSKKALNVMRGTNDECPEKSSRSYVTRIDKCATCPEGRVLLSRR